MNESKARDAACKARPSLPLLALMGMAALSAALGSAQAQTPLADQPLFSTTAVPGNLALPLSVEYPTAVSVAHSTGYDSNTRRLGYFDPAKCYSYRYRTAAQEAGGDLSYFYPDGLATATYGCTNRWSGNFLNWATMQTIDPFRSALTGGNRVIDSTTTTVLEKALASGQGGTGNFPNREILGTAAVSAVTPLSFTNLRLRVEGLGNVLRFTRTALSCDGNGCQGQTGPLYNGTIVPYDPSTPPGANSNRVYEVKVRVQVCVPDVPGFPAGAGIESNCQAYGSNYKPEGLIQQYSSRIRYSVFGYMNDSSVTRDAGVLRARQKFVGPQEPRPGLPSIANTVAEWNATTGVFNVSPDVNDVNATLSANGLAAADVPNSGVINYINKFGRTGNGTYKDFDPVSELYYAAIRYFRNLGNVPEWSNTSGGTLAERQRWVDGFPVITDWDDPIQYSCQRNFILGIGDVNTWNDKNVPGSTASNNEPAKPALVQSDASVDAVAETNRIGAMEGLGNIGSRDNYSGRSNSAYIAGLAYDAHTRDIRPDNAAVPRTLGLQTISTYWLDVLEYQTYVSRNQFWLATKYGGFTVPAGYNPDAVNAAPAQASWSTTTDRVGGDARPDNYFIASRPDQVIDGLTRAFSQIASELQAYSTSFSTAAPQFFSTGTTSYSSQYDSRNWTGEVSASTLTFNAGFQLSQAPLWSASVRMGTQFAATGWDSNRRVVSFDPAANAAVAFRGTGGSRLSDAQLANFATSYVGTDTPTMLVNYLRGDRSNERGAPSAAAQNYRARTTLLGDVVNSKAVAVAGPSARYTDAFNPGYAAFRTLYANRPVMVYVGANDGMLHAIDGSANSTGGTEVFAYVPSAVIAGPNGTPSVDGLAARANPNFVHRYYVDATPRVLDIDLARTGGPATGSPTPRWASILVGGLGKGGRSYYAIDVTDPATMTSEAAVAARVKWEFPNVNTPAADRALFGYSYGDPIAVKTAKWGWVIVLASGFNNGGDQGHFFFVNPDNGNLLERVSTSVGTPGNPAGLAHVVGFTRNLSDGTVDALYGGDLLGNLWRLNVTETRPGVGYEVTGVNPRRIASFTAVSGGAAQPVTTAPIVEVHPSTRERYVMVGTGRLLDPSDLNSGQQQSFYAIKDGTVAAANTPASLPAGVNFPIDRTVLVNKTNTLTEAITRTEATTFPMGWYVDLGSGGAAAVGWRVTQPATASAGRVAFASLLPGGDACSPAGTSRVYAIDFFTGRSTLVVPTQTVRDDSAPRLPFVDNISGLVTDLRYTRYTIRDAQTGQDVGDGGIKLTYGTSSGELGNPPESTPASADFRRLNWREIPAPQ